MAFRSGSTRGHGLCAVLFSVVVVAGWVSRAGLAHAQDEYGPRDPDDAFEPEPTSAPVSSRSVRLPKSQVGQRNLGLLANLGTWSATGIGAYIGTASVGLRPFIGFEPFYASVGGNIEYYMGFMGGADVSFNLRKPREHGRVGFLGGYRYSDIAGHGLGLGVWGGVRLSRMVDLYIQGGVLVFPKGEEGLRRKANLPASTTFGFPSPSVMPAVGVAFAIFPEPEADKKLQDRDE